MKLPAICRLILKGTMMKSMKKLAAVMSAAGLLVAAAPAHSIPTFTFVSPNPSYGTQTVDPFAGFDYLATNSAVSQGFNVGGFGLDGTVFHTYYLASTLAINEVGGNTANVDGLTANGAPGTKWEITVAADIQEVAQCVNLACTTVKYTAVGGSYNIYYDSTADSVRNTGTGFTNGTKIIGGLILPGVAGNFESSSITPNPDGTGSGDFTFNGNVTFTNTAPLSATNDATIAPELVTSLAGAQLRLGAFTAGYSRPTAFNDFGFGSLPPQGTMNSDLIVFQADGSQSFGLLPEPGTLALLGLSLVGFGFTSRRRKG